jgi:hypothetical protein
MVWLAGVFFRAEAGIFLSATVSKLVFRSTQLLYTMRTIIDFIAAATCRLPAETA